MKQRDKKYCIERYTERFQKYGYSNKSIGWGDQGKESIRYQVLFDIGIEKNNSVLDVGCGFGDFRKFLVKKDWNDRYVGIDIVDSFLFEAKKQQEDIDVRNHDILEKEIGEKFDYVISSGIFNAKLKEEDNYSFIERMISEMLNISKIGVAVDFISTYVDYQEDLLFYSDPGKILKIASKFTNRLLLRHDYMPFEFTVYIFKNDKIQDNVHIFESEK